MGAGTIQKGALGQQLAAAGRARRADQIGRSKKGSRKGGPGRDRSRAVIEDQMDQNDATGKQKQGKGGRPGKPIVSRPIEGNMPPKEGRPFEPPKEDRPIEDDYFDKEKFDKMFPDGPPVRTLPYFPGEGSLPGRPPEGRPFKPGRGFPGGPPIREKPIRGKDQFGPGDIPGKIDDGQLRRKEQLMQENWNRRRKEMEMNKGGGTDFGPGRGSRIPEGADKGRPFGNDQLPKGFKGGGFLQDFLARISQLKGGGIK